MALDDRTATAVGFLLRMADDGVAERVRTRLGLDEGRAAAGGVVDNSFRGEVRQAPAQVRLWLLQADDPEVNATLFGMGLLPAGLARDVVAGVPFGPGDAGRRIERSPYVTAVRPDDERLGEGLALPRILDRLYGAVTRGSLKRARRAAQEVRTADWPGVAAAHAERPLPGYARWALAERFDCPPSLRTAFGTHAKFTHRLREAGIVEGLDDLVTGVAPAITALPLLDVLYRAQPRVVDRSAAAVRPLVHERLGSHVEAWAIVAQLLPEFIGTTAELVDLAAAIAGPEPEGSSG
ncbi:hypothetical protein ACGFX4_13955 [Kitasatospora sp. NPDC048365]|uniref:hypothetical protein n=1 Tax=Kitasatospora sp. NPDC048365 TaxID=3364050 RepID=UPI0037178AFD